MRQRSLFLSVVSVVSGLLMGATAQAAFISSSTANFSGSQAWGSGTVSYSGILSVGDDLSISRTNLLSVTLTNTSNTSGNLTGFLLNFPVGGANPVTGASNLTRPQTWNPFGGSGNDLVNGQPYGNFDFGAGSGNGNFSGGGNPNFGLASGATRTFLFQLTGTATAPSFLSALSTPQSPGGQTAAFLARFQALPNINGDTSLKLPASPVPIPAAAILFGSGIVSLFALARRKMA